MTPALRVVIADDYPVIVEGLQKLLIEAMPIELAGTARSFAEVIALLARVECDVLVLDLNGMGGSPLALMNRLQREYPLVRVVIYSSMVDFAPEMLEAGARGYVTKDEIIREMVQAIEAVARGELFFSPQVQEYLDYATRETLLSSKELIALKLLVEGLPTAQIAERMGVHLHTAQNHITALRRKTGCIQRVQLVDWYRRRFGKN